MSHNTQNTTHDTPDEALTGRYASTIGWDPNRPKPNESEIAQKAKLAQDEYRTRKALARAIQVRPARELMRRDPDEDPQPTRAPSGLLPPFWYEGQLTALTGPSCVENSLIAVQLAETIAGTLTLPSASSPPTARCPLPTFYFDLSRTRRQYREIYTHNGRRYRFSQHLNFGLLAGEPLPERYTKVAAKPSTATPSAYSSPKPKAPSL
jgi:hypothetical protein